MLFRDDAACDMAARAERCSSLTTPTRTGVKSEFSHLQRSPLPRAAHVRARKPL